MILRPYQTECVGRIFEQLAVVKSTLAVLATGLGKTVIFSEVCRRWTAGRVLVLAHREELIRQAAEKVGHATGGNFAVEMADERSDERGLHGAAKVVVASVQTMTRAGRREKFDPAAFGLVIVDEAHHAVGRSYRAIFDHFPGAKLLGVTATPKRADELAMGQIFESVAFDYGIEAAGDDGWLVPVRQKVVQIEELDFSQVRTTAGDLNEGDLEKILAQEKVLHAVAAPAVELAGDRPALVFCVSVNHAKLMAEILGRYKPQCAQWLSGESAPDERRRWVAAYKAGGVQFLCNCGLFLEGFDAPSTAVIVMARPTKSLPLYTQVIGRGTRTLPGVLDGLEEAAAAERCAAVAASRKPYMDVLDFAGNAGRHKIVTAADVLGGRYGEPVRQYAKQTTAEEGEAAPVREALERAADELAFLREEEERARRAEVKAAAKWRAREVSVFDGGDRGASRVGGGFDRTGPRATPGQVSYLAHLGVKRETAEQYSRSQASAVIGKLTGKAAG